jgi:hypothetical protein
MSSKGYTISTGPLGVPMPPGVKRKKGGILRRKP